MSAASALSAARRSLPYSSRDALADSRASDEHLRNSFVSLNAMKRTAKKIPKLVKGRSVTIGLTQMACSPDVDSNRAKQAKLIERAAKDGAQIICTQELFTSQYFCQIEDHRFFKLAETIPGPSTDAFSKIAKKNRVV